MSKSETQQTLEAAIAQQNDAGLVYIFDTTLRDGEQCPGAAMTEDQKLEVAHRLEALGVDVIEAGFPVSSPVQFRAVQRVSRELETPIIAALARAVPGDIKIAAEALQQAVVFRPLSMYSIDPDNRLYGMNLGFAAVPTEKIEAPALKLVRLVEGQARKNAGQR